MGTVFCGNFVLLRWDSLFRFFYETRSQLICGKDAQKDTVFPKILSTTNFVISGKQEQTESHKDGEQPLNLSNKPVGYSPLTPTPPLLTPHVKTEQPPLPGAALRAAFNGCFRRNLSSTGRPLLQQNFHLSGGTVTVNPDPKFTNNPFNSVSPVIQDLVREIKKEPDNEFNNPVFPPRGQMNAENSYLQQEKLNTPTTASRDSPSPMDEEGTFANFLRRGSCVGGAWSRNFFFVFFWQAGNTDLTRAHVSCFKLLQTDVLWRNYV